MFCFESLNQLLLWFFRWINYCKLFCFHTFFLYSSSLKSSKSRYAIMQLETIIPHKLLLRIISKPSNSVLHDKIWHVKGSYGVTFLNGLLNNSTKHWKLNWTYCFCNAVKSINVYSLSFTAHVLYEKRSLRLGRTRNYCKKYILNKQRNLWN